MKTRAAVAVEAGKPLEIMDVDLEGPRSGEVLVEIKATGICHTDEFTLSGDDPEGLFPAILGHEGAVVVREVGNGVKSRFYTITYFPHYNCSFVPQDCWEKSFWIITRKCEFISMTYTCCFNFY